MSALDDLQTVRAALNVGHQWRRDPHDGTFTDALAALDRLEAAGRDALRNAHTRGVNVASLLEGGYVPPFGVF